MTDGPFNENLQPGKANTDSAEEMRSEKYCRRSHTRTDQDAQGEVRLAEVTN